MGQNLRDLSSLLFNKSEQENTEDAERFKVTRIIKNRDLTKGIRGIEEKLNSD